MARIAKNINSFNGGEWDPELEGRTDIPKYGKAASVVENFILKAGGGAHRRPGTRFVKECIDSTKKSRLIPFVYSTTQAYMLEFSEYKIRVFADELQVDVEEHDLTNPSTTTDEFTFTDHGYVDQQGPFRMTASAGYPAPLDVNTDYYVSMPPALTFTTGDVSAVTNDITFGSPHGYSANQGPFRLTTTGWLPFLSSSTNGANVDYYILVSSPTVIQLSLTAGGAVITDWSTATVQGTHTIAPTGNYLRDSFRLSLTAGGAPIDITTAGTAPHTFTPNPLGTPATLPLEIPTPYTEAQLYDLKFTQSADFLFITHKSHRPAQLTRGGDTKWSLDFVSIIDGPFLIQNIDPAKLLTPLASAVGNTWITSSGGFLNAFVGKMNGRLIRIVGASSLVGYAEVNSEVVSGGVQVTVRSVLGGIAADEDWTLSEWYDGNWPSAISFFEQRLGMTGEDSSPQTLHGSQKGFFNAFGATELDNTVVASNAVNFTIAMNQVNAIRWMAVGDRLVIGTSDSLFTARGSFDGEPITPSNINVQRITSVGASAVQPVIVADEVVYVTTNHQGLRGFRMATNADAVVPTDVTLLAKHIFGRTLSVTDMTYQQDRNNLVHCVRSDGQAPVATYVPAQEVTAWGRTIVGGSFSTGSAVIESMATIPSPTETHDQTWLTVKRTIDGDPFRSVEFFEDEWLDDDPLSMRFMDSAPLAYSGAAVSTISGLDHLEGETVQVLAGGAPHPDRVVASGSITLDAEYTDVVAGLGYTSQIETLRLDVPDPEGDSTGKVSRIDHIIFRLYKSLGGEFSADGVTWDPLTMREMGDPMDEPTPVFTGDKKVPFDGGFKRSQKVYFRQTDPLPLNVLSLNHMGSGGTR